MKEMSNQDITRFSNIIIAVTSSVIEQTLGVAQENSAIRYRFSPFKRSKNGNVHVYFKDDNKIVIDVFINMIFGYSMPAVMSAMQDNIKNEVELATQFVVESVNVNIVNVIFK